MKNVPQKPEAIEMCIRDSGCTVGGGEIKNCENINKIKHVINIIIFLFIFFIKENNISITNRQERNHNPPPKFI